MDRQPCLSLEGQQLVHDVEARVARYPEARLVALTKLVVIAILTFTVPRPGTRSQLARRTLTTVAGLLLIRSATSAPLEQVSVAVERARQFCHPWRYARHWQPVHRPAMYWHVAAGRAVGDPVGQETQHRASITVDREDEPPLPALGGAKGKARGAVVGRDLLSTARGLVGQDVGSAEGPGSMFQHPERIVMQQRPSTAWRWSNTEALTSLCP